MMKARDNPFASHRMESIGFRPQGMDWAELWARLDRLNRRAAIVGPCGSGKTTLVRELGRRLSDEGARVHSIRLSEERRRMGSQAMAALGAGLGDGDVLLLDGAEQLDWMQWWRIRRMTRRSGGLIITSHRAGFLPTLIECRTSPELLADLAGELSGLGAESCRSTAAEMFQRHGGNVREALREWYDRQAQPEAVEKVPPIGN
jgi:hypothetical protein